MLKAPFPYMGGKSKVAAAVWCRLGAVRNYVEPFAGSLAVLLRRPGPVIGTETVNDVNGWLCNFWRSLQADPDGVAHYADWPVSELDLHARGDWLFYRPGVEEFIEKMRSDPDYFDIKSAGWWVWGQSSWIGDNWGRKDCRSRPHLGNAGKGVNRSRPHLGNAGKGVNRQLPHLGNAGTGLQEYLRNLSERLRKVRVCCGDWSRVCGPSPTVKLGTTAMFFDPPYSVADRDDCYGEHDSRTVAADVWDWCREHQDDSLLRIALCGYEGEHNLPGWECFEWKAHGGYSNQAKIENENRKRERIWFSPSCLRETTLLDLMEAV